MLIYIYIYIYIYVCAVFSFQFVLLVCGCQHDVCIQDFVVFVVLVLILHMCMSTYICGAMYISGQGQGSFGDVYIWGAPTQSLMAACMMY